MKPKILLAMALMFILVSVSVWFFGWVYYEAELSANVSEETYRILLITIIGAALFALVMFVYSKDNKKLSSLKQPPTEDTLIPVAPKPEKKTEEELKYEAINESVKKRRETFASQFFDEPEKNVSATTETSNRRATLEKRLEEVELERKIAIQERFIQDVKQGRIIIEPAEDENKTAGKGSLGYRLKRANPEEQQQQVNDSPDNDLYPQEDRNLEEN